MPRVSQIVCSHVWGTIWMTIRRLKKFETSIVVRSTAPQMRSTESWNIPKRTSLEKKRRREERKKILNIPGRITRLPTVWKIKGRAEPLRARKTLRSHVSFNWFTTVRGVVLAPVGCLWLLVSNDIYSRVVCVHSRPCGVSAIFAESDPAAAATPRHFRVSSGTRGYLSRPLLHPASCPLIATRYEFQPSSIIANWIFSKFYAATCRGDAIAPLTLIRIPYDRNLLFEACVGAPQVTIPSFLRKTFTTD